MCRLYIYFLSVVVVAGVVCVRVRVSSPFLLNGSAGEPHPPGKVFFFLSETSISGALV